MAAKASSKSSDVVQQYEKALQLIHNSKYSQALNILQGLKKVQIDEFELHARVDNYIRLCERKSQPEAPLPSSAEELYDLGVFNHNARNYPKALELFEAALKKSSDADYVHYAIAATEAKLGKHEPALEHLGKAVEASRRNLILAQADPDLEKLRELEGFKKLARPV